MAPMDKLVNPSLANLQISEELYEKYKHNPGSVPADWQAFFRNLDAYQESQKAPLSNTSYPPGIETVETHLTESAVRIFNLIHAYRSYGHLMADTNPIALHPPEEPLQLKISTLGFHEEELTRLFPTCGLLEEEIAPLQKIIDVLKTIYCSHIGVEYMEMHSVEMEQWLQQHIEPSRFRMQVSLDQKRMILNHLNKSEIFESFLHTKYVGQKRFSLEGAETLIPIMEAIVETGSQLGAEEFVIGMAHRGRLNVLSNIMNKSYGLVFSEFEEHYVPALSEGSGDVKYHKGYESEVQTSAGKQVRISMSSNPSHLESVDPVVEGEVRARQLLKGDLEKQEKVIPLLIHGDAALSGQGVIYETMQFYKLPGYSSGGTIHVVINNQIGFTTLPNEARSTPYCTDIALAFGCPVFHVNAEDPEGCVFATNLAVQMRQKFHCDVFIDLICYRKYGHNETDEPAFTQPLQYQIIRKKRPIREIYRDRLIQQGDLEKNLAEDLENEFKKTLQDALKEIQASVSEKITEAKENQQKSSLNKKIDLFAPFEKRVSEETLRMLANLICTIPQGFNIHPKVEHLLKERQLMAKAGSEARPIDWGMGELLAYATLLWEGVSVRLSGQDSCRGTFSHRHAIWTDQVEERKYSPLANLKPGQGRFDVYNSSLSEYAVLGFEFGYSAANLDALVLWEAQFGDFCNGAQIIIDQYVTTAEQKWGRKSNLVMLLPHGYEGQGPEHSSGRMERFLVLAGNQNIQVVDPTTPAQLYHLFRRQALRGIYKPLIIFTPKGLLRHPECVSQLGDLATGTFQEVLDDPSTPKNVKKLVFCTGRFYYDLKAAREKFQEPGLAIVRIEQLYPLHEEKIKEYLSKYQGFDECFWVQEEPSNMGAWGYIQPLLGKLLPKNKELQYIGRERCASPAAGSHALHKKEHETIMDALFKRNRNENRS